jgi:Flp pilus assembly protein TadD
VSPSTPTPDEVLAAPAAVTQTPVPPAVTGSAASTTIPAPSEPVGPDVYYDSRAATLPPSGPLANSVGPRKVDPISEPASKLVISNRTHSAHDQEALIVAANRALDLGRNESALEMFDQLYAKNKRDARILMGRAVAQHRLGLDDLAILSYEEVLNLAPDNTEAIVNMMGLICKQYPEVALRRLSDLRDKYPANDLVIAQLGMVHATMGNMNEAIRMLTTAATIAPNNALHLYNLAVLSDRNGLTDKAIKYYQDALKTDAVHGGGKSVPRAQIYDRLSQLR